MVKTIYKAKDAVKSIDQMLEFVGIEREGRAGAGLDDTLNYAKIALKCMELDFQFTQGMVHQSRD